MRIKKENSFIEINVSIPKQTDKYVIYSLNCPLSGEIPFCKKGKRLYFSKQDLTDWIKSGRNKTNAEINSEAHTYLKRNKS